MAKGKFKQRIGRPLMSAPGKSAAAPGQRMKALGLPNASSLAPGRKVAGRRPPNPRPSPIPRIGPGPTRSRVG